MSAYSVNITKLPAHASVFSVIKHRFPIHTQRVLPEVMKNTKSIAATCKSGALKGELTHRYTVRESYKLQLLQRFHDTLLTKRTNKVAWQQK